MSFLFALKVEMQLFFTDNFFRLIKLISFNTSVLHGFFGTHVWMGEGGCKISEKSKSTEKS